MARFVFTLVGLVMELTWAALGLFGAVLGDPWGSLGPFDALLGRLEALLVRLGTPIGRP